MAEIIREEFVYDLARPLASAWQRACVSLIPGNDLTFEWALDVRLGYRAVRFVETYPADTVTTYFIFAPLAAESVGQMRAAMAAGWFNGVDSITEFSYSAEEIDFATMRAQWGSDCVEMIKLIIETWFEATCEEPVYWGITAAGDKISSYSAVLRITTDTETMAVTRTQLVSRARFSGASEVVHAPSGQYAAGQTVLIGSGGDQLAAISQGIADLAHRSVVQSVNGGTAIADLATQDVVTPP